jgi:hypothetical protein
LLFRSKVNFENIFKFLGFDFLYPVNTIFAQKPIAKKLLSIEIMIFHTLALSVAKSEKYRSQEVALNKLEKGPLRDYDCFLFTSGTYGSGEEDF